MQNFQLMQNFLQNTKHDIGNKYQRKTFQNSLVLTHNPVHSRFTNHARQRVCNTHKAQIRPGFVQRAHSALASEQAPSFAPVLAVDPHRNPAQLREALQDIGHGQSAGQLRQIAESRSMHAVERVPQPRPVFKLHSAAGAIKGNDFKRDTGSVRRTHPDKKALQMYSHRHLLCKLEHSL